MIADEKNSQISLEILCSFSFLILLLLPRKQQSSCFFSLEIISVINLNGVKLCKAHRKTWKNGKKPKSTNEEKQNSLACSSRKERKKNSLWALLSAFVCFFHRRCHVIVILIIFPSPLFVLIVSKHFFLPRRLKTFGGSTRECGKQNWRMRI